MPPALTQCARACAAIDCDTRGCRLARPAELEDATPAFFAAVELADADARSGGACAVERRFAMWSSAAVQTSQTAPLAAQRRPQDTMSPAKPNCKSQCRAIHVAGGIRKGAASGGKSAVCSKQRVTPKSISKSPVKGGIRKGGAASETAVRRDSDGKKLCRHNRREYRCVECGGAGICKHKKQRHRCVDCKSERQGAKGSGNGSAASARVAGKIVACSKQRNTPKSITKSPVKGGKRKDGAASGTAVRRNKSGKVLCHVHGRILYQCVPCGGAGTCSHQRRRSDCRICKSERQGAKGSGNGSAASARVAGKIVACSKQRNTPKSITKSPVKGGKRKDGAASGTAVRRNKSGKVLCHVHGRILYRCVPCGGAGICRHQRRRSDCRICKSERQGAKGSGNGSAASAHVGGKSLACSKQRVTPKSITKSPVSEKGGIKKDGAASETAVRRDSNGQILCRHDRRKHRCVECGGAGICLHQKRRDQCVDCKSERQGTKGSGNRSGASARVAGKNVARSKQRVTPKSIAKFPVKGGIKKCGAASETAVRRDNYGKILCHVHGRVLYQCIPCGGAGICQHKTRRTVCRICKSERQDAKGSGNGNGASACVGRNGLASEQRVQAKITAKSHVKGGNSRGAIAAIIRDVYGKVLCHHNRRLYDCIPCHGGGICQHGRHRTQCKECQANKSKV